MIQFRRLASFLAGAWLAASLTIDLVQLENPRSADRFLSSPELSIVDRAHGIGSDPTRSVLRRFAASQNQRYREQWEWSQMALGLGLLLCLVFGGRPSSILIGLALLMLAIALSFRFGVTPWMDTLARETDVPVPDIPLTVRLTTLARVYSIMEILKLTLGFVMAAFLLVRKRADPGLFARASETAQAATRLRSLKQI